MTGADRRTRQRRRQAIRQRLASYEAWPRTGPGSGCSLAAAARDPGPREASGAVRQSLSAAGGPSSHSGCSAGLGRPLAGTVGRVSGRPGPCRALARAQAAHWPPGARRTPPGAVLARELSMSAWQYYGMIRAKKRKANLKPVAEQ